MRSILLLLCCAFVSVSPVRAADSRPPNIIHILADDIAYDDVGCFGAPKIKTPNIDRMASEGVRLTSFYAPSPTCIRTARGSWKSRQIVASGPTTLASSRRSR